MKKTSYDDVKKFVEENDCELISKEYKGAHYKLKIKCKCDNEFEVSFSNFKHGNKRTCNECSVFKLEKKICPICKKEFRPRNFKTIYCCKKCKTKSQEDKVFYKCDYCGKECSVKKSQYKKAEKHFCDKNCFDLFQLDRIEYKCDYCGKINSYTKTEFGKYKKHFCDNVCSGKFKEGINNYFHKHVLRGEKHPSFNPNLSEEQRLKRANTIGYSFFRLTVMRENDNRCVCCNRKANIVHHLNGFDWDIENRVNPTNGVALCERCHKEFHKIYGYGKNTVEQFNEFKRINYDNIEVN